MITLEPRSLDGVFSNWRSRKSSRKTRKETVLRLTQESFPRKVKEPSTELPTNTLRRKIANNDS
jgi:hypothetical protein